MRDACGPARLKVILETGELGSYDNVRRASVLAMAAGADTAKQAIQYLVVVAETLGPDWLTPNGCASAPLGR